jgi:hypothetical protein
LTIQSLQAMSPNSKIPFHLFPKDNRFFFT